MFSTFSGCGAFIKMLFKVFLSPRQHLCSLAGHHSWPDTCPPVLRTQVDMCPSSFNRSTAKRLCCCYFMLLARLILIFIMIDLVVWGVPGFDMDSFEHEVHAPDRHLLACSKVDQSDAIFVCSLMQDVPLAGRSVRCFTPDFCVRIPHHQRSLQLFVKLILASSFESFVCAWYAFGDYISSPQETLCQIHVWLSACWYTLSTLIFIR
jgi:hypothetical protein